MTEADWLAYTELSSLQQCLSRKFDNISERKMRLFGCACCRRIWHLITDERCQVAVEVAEQYAEGLTTRKQLTAARAEAESIAKSRVNDRGEYSPRLDARAAARVALRNGIQAGYEASDDAATVAACAHMAEKKHRDFYAALEIGRAAQVPYFRDIFGNPFRPMPVDPSWLTWNGGAVRKLAQVVYGERRFEDMPVLADALEDAGCDSAEILEHCRGAGPHVRGCWVLDLILGKG